MTGVAISPDGTWIATASRDCTARIWDAASGSTRATLAGHANGVTGVAISPDGTWLATVGANHTARIWDAATGVDRAKLPGPGRARATSRDRVAISPDGTWLATTGWDSTPRIWDAATGSELATLYGHAGAVSCLAISPDGTWLATTSDDGTARLWDVASGSELATLAGHTGMVHAVAISPDGTWLVTAGSDMTARLWDAGTGTERARLVGHTADALGLGSVWGVAISPDGTWLATTGMDHTARIWDAATGSELATLYGHTDGVPGVAIGPDGTWLATVGEDRACKLWDAPSGSMPAGSTGHSDQVNDMAFSRDGTRLATAGGDGSVRVWDVATGAERLTLGGHTGGVRGVAISPDDIWLATASQDPRIWDVVTGTTRATHDGQTATVASLAISPDGTWLATASSDRTARTWDAATGGARATLIGHTGWVTRVAISPDGAWLATASDDHSARIWDMATGAPRATLTGHTGGLRGIAISPDATWLATTSMDRDPVAPSGDIRDMIEAIAAAGHEAATGNPVQASQSTPTTMTARIWDAATGAERVTLMGHIGRVHGVAICPDGTWLATTGWDNTARIWDAATGADRATLMGHTALVTGVAISPDGTWLATASWDNTARIWDAATGTEQATLALGGQVNTVAVHPFAPVIACSDDGGGVHLARLVGIDLGPLLVTAAEAGGTLTVRCPACRQPLLLDFDQLGSRTTCPRPGCDSELQVNPFSIHPGAATPVVLSPMPRATPSLTNLMTQSGLRYLDIGGGSLAVSFEGTRAERLIVHARTLAGGLAFFAVSLPKPGMFGGEAALRSLLGVSFRADYVKALVLPDGELALACEQHLPLLSPARVRGLVAGLAALGDVRKDDLADAAGWDRRLVACGLAKAADIALDPALATAAIRDLAARRGLVTREAGSGTLVVGLQLQGTAIELRLAIQVSEGLISFIASFGDLRPKGNKGVYMRRMLELNRSADVARVALDTDGNVALLYEVPEVGPELLDQIGEQFGPLLAGLTVLERGG